MLTQRELQDLILELLPTYHEELKTLEERLIQCGAIDRHGVGEFTRSGIHIMGTAPPSHKQAGERIAIDYIPSDHTCYVIRHQRSEVSEADKDILRPARGNEVCPLCGKPVRVSLSDKLDTKDLILVVCPVIKEGERVVDVLPVFSTTLMRSAFSLDLPHQHSKLPMTRVGKLFG